MITSREALLAIAKDVFLEDLPKPFLVLDNLKRVEAGENLNTVARDARTTRKNLERIAAATDTIEAIFDLKLSSAYAVELLRKARNGVGQLTLGVIAERVFEEIYDERMKARGLHLEDARYSRNETDYRVLNGTNRPMFRINIKFYGSPFRKAQDLVGLEPPDCFALATYKIHQVAASILTSYRRAVEREVKARLSAADAVEAGHFGETGKRLRGIEVTVLSIRSIAGNYGAVDVHKFRTSDGHQLVWFASCDSGMERGETYKVDLTVKRHAEYRGVPETHVNRVSVN